MHIYWYKYSSYARNFLPLHLLILQISFNMLSKNQIKSIHSLEQKKQRILKGLFLAEGPKVVLELLQTHRCHLLVGLDDWLTIHQEELKQAKLIEQVTTASADELKQASLLCHPQSVLAVFYMPPQEKDQWSNTLIKSIENNLCLMLDDVQDPGNLGTIIRMCDWFGIDQIFCSIGTADCYNPKVIQATMGAISRIKIHYGNLCHLLDTLPSGTPIYGSLLDGKDIYQQELTNHGILIMGNEGKGISKELQTKLTHKLFLPTYPDDRNGSESLNVAIATALICGEFRRRNR